MPPDADPQMPKLELNDQMVTDDDQTGLQPVIDHASRMAYEDHETPNFKLQMRLSLGAYYHVYCLPFALAQAQSFTEDALLKTTDDRVAVAGLYNVNENSIKTVAAVVSTVVDAKAIEDHIKTFAEGSKVLMKALDEISKIHPFIAGNYCGKFCISGIPRMTCRLYSYRSGLQSCDYFGAQAP